MICLYSQGPTKIKQAYFKPIYSLKNDKMRPTQLTKFLGFSIENRLPVLITGKPGIGKSEIVYESCGPKMTASGIQLDIDLIISHPVVSDPTDYKGLPFPGKDGKTAHFLPFGELQALIEASKPTVFFLDDLGQAPPSVQAACMQLLLARRINGFKVSDFVTFIAATNRRQDKAGVSGILEPVKSRFSTIVDLEVNAEDWVTWALTHNMPVELIAFIRFMPDILDKFEATKDMTNSPSPRSIANAGRIQAAGYKDDLLEVFTGSAGKEFANAYMSFYQTFANLPSIDSIILAPDRAEVSNDPAVRYAISAMLAHNMTEHNLGPIMTYIKRMPAEIGVATMQNAIIRKPELMTTKPFVKWGADNNALIS